MSAAAAHEVAELRDRLWVHHREGVPGLSLDAFGSDPGPELTVEELAGQVGELAGSNSLYGDELGAALLGAGSVTLSKDHKPSTCSNHRTARKHWYEFTCDLRLPAVLQLDLSKREDLLDGRDTMTMYGSYLVRKVQGVDGEGLGLSGTIHGYMNAALNAHYECAGVDLRDLKVHNAKFAQGREEQLVEVRGPREPKKKAAWTFAMFMDFDKLGWRGMSFQGRIARTDKRPIPPQLAHDAWGRDVV